MKCGSACRWLVVFPAEQVRKLRTITSGFSSLPNKPRLNASDWSLSCLKMDDFFSRIRARSEGTERKPLASGALRMLSTLLLLIFVCWRNLTRWCARRSRVRRRTDSAPDRSWSTRATRRRWPRSDTRSGSAVPFRTGRRTDLCSDR